MVDLQVTLNTGTETQLSEKVLADFKAGFRGMVLMPEDTNYDEVRVLSNAMHDKRPALITRCTGTADVIAAVNFARDNNLLVAVRGGGHSDELLVLDCARRFVRLVLRALPRGPHAVSLTPGQKP